MRDQSTFSIPIRILVPSDVPTVDNSPIPVRSVPATGGKVCGTCGGAGSRREEIQRFDACGACGGSGQRRMGKTTVNCGSCGGKGGKTRTQHVQQTCRSCGGSGYR